MPFLQHHPLVVQVIQALLPSFPSISLSDHLPSSPKQGRYPSSYRTSSNNDLHPISPSSVSPIPFSQSFTIFPIPISRALPSLILKTINLTTHTHTHSTKNIPLPFSLSSYEYMIVILPPLPISPLLLAQFPY